MRGIVVTALVFWGVLYALIAGKWEYVLGLPLLWLAYVLIAAHHR